jgi:hypothetical protein
LYIRDKGGGNEGVNEKDEEGEENLPPDFLQGRNVSGQSSLSLLRMKMGSGVYLILKHSLHVFAVSERSGLVGK